MRSWIAEAGLAARTAWVTVDSELRDPQGFWVSVADALRGTAAGSALVRPLTAAPGLDGWAVIERLLKDLAPLDDRLWLAIDDAHVLDSAEVLAQLELLVLRAPRELRFVLASRHDLKLGLHRLRLEGELTEIRAADLRFSLAEAAELFAATGVELPAQALARLHGRTEGWAAGLRLATLSLAGHPDPERFAEEFSGTDRTVAEFLLAEVLERQSEEVRRLLVRTSVLERVSGPLADALTGGSDGERILQDLEQAGAFVVSLDASRTWFRYHQLFADLLRLELRRSEPNERAMLHRAAAVWLTGHGHPVEAVRQAQAAQDWGMAARLLSDHWLDLYLAGRGATLVELLARFPRRVVLANPELTAVQAAGDLVRGAQEDARWHLAMAAGALAAVPADRRGRVQVMLAVLRLSMRSRMLQTLVRLGQLGHVEQALAGLGEDERGSAEMRIATAALRLASAEPQAAADALAPVLDGSVSAVRLIRMVTALLLEAQVRDALGDQAAAGRVLERALDITKSNGMLLPFLLDPVPELLDRHRGYRTSHPALISRLLDAQRRPARAVPPGAQAPWVSGRGLDEPLTNSETRVLRYLPTHLTAPDIANELCLSVNTVNTHMRHVYAKLGAHSRQQAVNHARALGLLAPAR
jgi:LuxR family maltose regulon positive regulatory protein